ncbi:hypothetical protein BU14_0696s0009 [Porphyra umbilicalis]|uniref:Uncharacterized protein n=1 Tax=Porphyra umbilicalis TaxID=2786 RepID=A0A1X6NQ58_PORUM|nr:hypothetical protein BU14_0696s0009 [Porphyra umbilicalis]|eukprot:OSX70660.1 hypothetical protein BU14_0696s0009 [Porphyra umbilicalis]
MTAGALLRRLPEPPRRLHRPRGAGRANATDAAPEDATAWHWLADALLVTGDTGRAWRALLSGLTHCPAHKALVAALARVQGLQAAADATRRRPPTTVGSTTRTRQSRPRPTRGRPSRSARRPRPAARRPRPSPRRPLAHRPPAGGGSDNDVVRRWSARLDAADAAGSPPDGWAHTARAYALLRQALAADTAAVDAARGGGGDSSGRARRSLARSAVLLRLGGGDVRAAVVAAKYGGDAGLAAAAKAAASGPVVGGPAVGPPFFADAAAARAAACRSSRRPGVDALAPILSVGGAAAVHLRAPPVAGALVSEHPRQGGNLGSLEGAGGRGSGGPPSASQAAALAETTASAARRRSLHNVLGGAPRRPGATSSAVASPPLAYPSLLPLPVVTVSADHGRPHAGAQPPRRRRRRSGRRRRGRFARADAHAASPQPAVVARLIYAHAVAKPRPSVMWPCVGMDAKRWRMASTRWHP